MAITTQRIILIVLTINLLFGFVVTMQDANSKPTDTPYLQTLEQDMDTGTDLLRDPDFEYGGTLNAEGQVEESSVANPIVLGDISFMQLLKNGINPLSHEKMHQTDTKFDILWTGITLFRILVYVTLAVELYFVLKNKKTT